MTLKVVSRRTDAGIVYLGLKGGGEIGVAAAGVRGFVPDEVVEEMEPQVAAGMDLRAMAVGAAQL